MHPSGCLTPQFLFDATHPNREHCRTRIFLPMNLKRWFPWLCLVLMLVSEIFLLRSNSARDAALTDLHEATTRLARAQSDLDDLKNANPGAQAAEINRLRHQNEILSNKLAALQGTIDKLQKESQQNSQHLDTARTALQLQQEHLQQLQAEKQQAAAQAAEAANAAACIANLRLIDSAKQQWALDKNKDPNSVPTEQDLLPYFKDGVFPVCPDGGAYSLNSMAEAPACTIAGHVLPAQ